MIANGAIAVLNFGGFLLTGSPSMLAEAYHSVSDTGNQVLLLVGIKQSNREATSTHPFGHRKAQFFYAFLVSVLLFGIAGLESLIHGIGKLRAGGHETEAGPAELLGVTMDVQTPVEPFWIAVVILLGAVVFETYAFLKARAELLRQMRQYGWEGYRETFGRTSDLMTLTAFTQDTVALIGLVVALVGLTATRITGNAVYDAAGAVVIDVLLMLFAAMLALENKRLIMGESMDEDVESDLRTVVENHEGVVHVDGLRSMFIGSGKALVTADVSFTPDLQTEGIDEQIQRIQEKLKTSDDRVKMCTSNSKTESRHARIRD